MKNGSSRAGKSPDPKRYITPADFARMVSVSRQYLTECFRDGKLSKTPGGYIDLLDERSILFVAEREGKKPASSAPSPKPRRPAPGSRKLSVPAGMRIDDDDGDEPDEAERDDLLSLQKRKLKAEITKRELEIATIEGSVIDEKIISSLIGELGQGIRLGFVDVCLRQSEQICAMLGVPGREREVQDYLEVDNGRRLEEVKRNITKIMQCMKRPVKEGDHE